jgi:hypothetical protein
LKRTTCARDLESGTAAGIGALLEWRKILNRENKTRVHVMVPDKKKETNDREPVQNNCCAGEEIRRAKMNSENQGRER